MQLVVGQGTIKSKKHCKPDILLEKRINILMIQINSGVSVKSFESCTEGRAITFLTLCIDHTNESAYCTNKCEDLTWNVFPVLRAALRKEMKPTIESLEENKGNDQTLKKLFVRKAGGES